MRLATLVSLLLAFAFPSIPATFTVNSTADIVDANPGDGICETAAGNGICTLRAAVQEAGALNAANTIIVPAGTYLLPATPSCSYRLVSNPSVLSENMSALCVRGTVTITGAGPETTIIDAGGAAGATCCGSYPSARGIVISVGAVVKISGITIQNGRSNGGYSWFGGGAINNQGSLTLSNSVLTTNIGPPGGGGIWNDGTLLVDNVTFSGNSGGQYGGGGLYNNTPGTAEVSNSSFNANEAQAGGAAILNLGTLKILATTLAGNIASGNGGGLDNSYGGSVTLTNVTIAANQASVAGALWNSNSGAVTANNTTMALNHATYHGGGVINSASSFTVWNTIIGGNYDDSNPSVFTDCEGPVISQGHNIIQGTSSQCTISGATSSDIYGQDPALAPLASNGGSTQTMALLAASPAIDAGDPSTPGTGGTACAAADQRGILRPQNQKCDIGAFESFGYLALTGISPAHAGNTGVVEGVISGGGIAASVTVKLRRSGQPDIVGTQITVQPGSSSMAALFDLTGRVPGPWDLVATNPDGTAAVLPGALTVDSGGSAHVWAQAVGPSPVRPGTSHTFYLVFGNRGNIDALDVPVTLAMPTEIGLDLNFLVQPPPAQAGQVVKDWTQVPLYALPGPSNGFVNVPLLLPIIPAGY